MRLKLKMVKNYYLKENPSLKIQVGPSESMSKSKKNTIDPQIMIDNYGADAVLDYLYCQIAHLKKIFNGLIRA